jgi:hypothetical protein
MYTNSHTHRFQLAVQVEEHQKKDIIQCLRRNAFKRQLSLKIAGHDQSTAANSVASVLELIIQRALTLSDNAAERRTLTSALDKRWEIGQRGTICKLGILQLSAEIIQELVHAAVDLSIENYRAVEQRRQEEVHASGLIWNRTSPGWRYFRAMHVYEELYTDQTLPHLAAVNELHSTTKEYYSEHIEKVVHSHTLKSATKRQGHSPTATAVHSPTRLMASQIEQNDTIHHASEELGCSSGLAISWKLRQKVQEDCASPARLAKLVVVDISPDAFGLKLSPHLSSALRHSGKQEKEQEFLQAIKQQAKCAVEETIAMYSVPSPTLVKRQKNRVRHECQTRFCVIIFWD